MTRIYLFNKYRPILTPEKADYIRKLACVYGPLSGQTRVIEVTSGYKDRIYGDGSDNRFTFSWVYPSMASREPGIALRGHLPIRPNLPPCLHAP